MQPTLPTGAPLHHAAIAARCVAVAVVAATAISWPTPVPAAKGRPHSVDLVWIHPGFDSLGLQAMALLPACSFTHDRPNERLVEAELARVLQPAGYRWVSPTAAREMIRALLGDSALTRLGQDVLEDGRVDSLAAPRLCRVLRTGGLMTIRLDLFEQAQVEWNQSGKPSTTVKLKAALVDSTGRLLWSASGSETGEGPYHEVGTDITGVKGSGLSPTPIAPQGGAPRYEEVTARLLLRWGPRFPAKKAPAQP